ncbi:hypothetical protein AVEN_254228-1 [Araneus ventricosus]|uniref:Uncharacterized protein n=1 Tax=Araneus ventricosus TaxID=182803 RepID=A0A4Y2PEU7_ARAVE|nr:hypothetical protein AVEN_254228-1 [Araneus ventricosus]
MQIESVTGPTKCLKSALTCMDKNRQSSVSFQNKARPAFLIKDLFEEVVYKEFQDYHIIVTDASKSHSFTSIAGISNLQSFVYRIHPINSIFTAEALAICQALDELSPR